MNYTLSYSQQAKGWPSRYSYYPDWMQGMNNRFYSWSGGNLWVHDTNPLTMNFYGEQGSALVQGVFNDANLSNKLFKTLSYEGDEAWTATLATDLQNGFINDEYFERKEGIWYAFVRVTSPTPADNFLLRSVNGIGEVVTKDDTNLAAVVVNFTVAVGTMISIGDYIYRVSAGVPQLSGSVTSVGANTITVNCQNPVGNPPNVGDLIVYVKNGVAESHGVLGRYCVFTVTNDSPTDAALYSVKTDYMLSYPPI